MVVKTLIKESFKPKDTFDIGKELGREAKLGDCVCLIGDLGTGKTLFAQGFASGIGIKEDVNSPTFTILQEYDDGRVPFYHFDVYRIEAIEEMEDIGFMEYVDGDGVCLIEWADKILELLPLHYTKIILEKDLEKGFYYRKVTIETK